MRSSSSWRPASSATAFGGCDVEVEVVEERGPLGVGGRHLVGILMPMEYAEPYELTVPEEDLRPIRGAA